MARYILRRTLQSIPLVIGISLIVFVLIHQTPGGPMAAYSHAKLSPEARAQIIRNLGLDQPIHIQYFRWLVAMLTGYWGRSFVSTRMVSEEILSLLPNTLLLMGTAYLVMIIVAIPLGIFSAIRRYTVFDHIVTGFSFFGMSMPTFWFGMMLILVFSVKLHWLPSIGMYTLGEEFSFWDRVAHLIMPVAVLCIISVASWSRYMRSSMIETLHQDFIRTARAKGLDERNVIWRHALKNAIIPVVTVMAIDLPMLFSGAIITETIFAWPGMGRLFTVSVASRDYPVLMALLFISSTLVVFSNLLADVIYAYLDPRIRYE